MNIEEKIKYSFDYGQSYLLSALELADSEINESKLSVPYPIRRAFYFQAQEIELEKTEKSPPYIFLYIHGIELLLKGILYFTCSFLPEGKECSSYLSKIQNTHKVEDIYALLQALKHHPVIAPKWKDLFDEEMEDCLYVIIIFHHSLATDSEFLQLEQMSRYGFLRNGTKFTEEKIKELAPLFGEDKRWVPSFVLSFFNLFAKEILK